MGFLIIVATRGATSAAPFYGDTIDKRTTQADKGDIFELVRKGVTAQGISEADFGGRGWACGRERH